MRRDWDLIIETTALRKVRDFIKDIFNEEFIKITAKELIISTIIPIVLSLSISSFILFVKTSTECKNVNVNVKCKCKCKKCSSPFPKYYQDNITKKTMKSLAGGLLLLCLFLQPTSARYYSSNQFSNAGQIPVHNWVWDSMSTAECRVCRKSALECRRKKNMTFSKSLSPG